MKNTIFIGLSLLLLIICFGSCNNKNKSKELENYSYDSSNVTLNEKLQGKVGSWIKEGVTCYGVVILNDEKGIPQKLKEVKAKVLIIQSDKIKMKALENITLAPVEGCSKIGIKRGDTWWETDGELYKSEEEAIQFIDKNYPGLRIK